MDTEVSTRFLLDKRDIEFLLKKKNFKVTKHNITKITDKESME